MDIKTWNAMHSAIFKLADCNREEVHCHYTTPEAFASIFASYIDGHMLKPVTDCTMRASHIRFMNDSQEYLEGVQWLRKNQRIVCNDLDDDIYSISFCGNEDLLSQWKWYGKNSGIAITFDMTNIKYKYYDVEEGLPDEDILTKPLPVSYTQREKCAFFKNIDSQCREMRLNQSSTVFRSNLFIPFCKNKGFAEEKESRLIFYTADAKDAGIKPFDIKYIPTGNILKPTLNVQFRAIDENKGIIKRLTVGPGQNQDLIYQALIHILGGTDKSVRNDKPKANGEIKINNVSIRKSSIPFRG